MFSKAEIERYSRHLILPDFTIEGQRKLKQAKVLVVGAGGLGSPLLQYLAAAGVGTIGIVDSDTVDHTNLQRQVLYGISSLGKAKVEEAKSRILDINPHIQVKVYPTHLTSENAMDIVQDYDLVADGTDNFPTRYLVNDACVLLNKPNIYASVFRFEGQVSVFNYTDSTDNTGPNYRDLYPTPPPPGMVPSCAEGGVLGVLPGIIGAMQALEAIKVISGIGEPLSGRLMLFDALDFTTRILKIPKNPDNPLTGKNPTQTSLIDYEQFCGMGNIEQEVEFQEEVPSISVKELFQWQKEEKVFQLVDVREPHEYDIVNLGGTLIPKDTIEARITEIAKDTPVVLHCRSGVRSAKVAHLLTNSHQLHNVFNLEGGILAYAREIDPELPVY